MNEALILFKIRDVFKKYRDFDLLIHFTQTDSKALNTRIPLGFPLVEAPL